MKKLKACPWCGWTAGRLRIESVNGRAVYYIRCDMCGVSSKPSRFRKLAEIHWNRNRFKRTKTRHHIFGREF